MRSRRPVRHNIPQFNLALPNDSSFGEVQVQKNELDVNKFFIDMDDATVSPMITTQPTFDKGSIEEEKTQQKGSASVSPSVSNTPKFIHVNNTNIFVLMDGVSMFIEGHSTFNGDENTQLVQRYITEKAKKQKEALLDTLTEAIKDIEKGNSNSSFAMNNKQDTASSNVKLASSSHLPLAPTRDGAPTLPSLARTNTTENVEKTPPPSRFGDLFKDAKRPPHGPGLFGRKKLYPAPPSKDTKELKVSTRPSSAQSPVTSKPSRDSSALLVQSSPLSPATSQQKADVSSNVSLASPTIAKATTDLGASIRHNKKNHPKPKKLVSSDDIGRSNRTLDLDEVEILFLVGVGSQGKVYQVKVDEKLYAMKRIDVKEATEAANSIERHGRKRGLVKELNMIRLQRERPPPMYLMQMFNGVASVDNERQHLSILMELMSFSVEDLQKMCARIPQYELMRVAQSTFRDYFSGSTSAKLRQEVDALMKQQNGSCMHVLGRSHFNQPEDWEQGFERQTYIPEVVLSLLAADVLKGLKELHNDYNMVHCDLKPANVLLNFEVTRFKLTDFGCGSIMDPETKKVRRTGVDLGSKLYKAPERLLNDYASNNSNIPEFASEGDLLEMEEHDEFIGSKEVVEFTSKSDVWSLGIMLLELANGEHPCKPFKSDFWNYVNLLKLSKMLKPLTFSPFLCDFIVRCVSVDAQKRWTIEKLLQHPFIRKYEDVPRNKLKSFVQKLEKESASFQRKQQKEALQQQILLSTTRQARDNYKNQSFKKWQSFTHFLKVAPEFSDTTIFPDLSSHMKPTKTH